MLLDAARLQPRFISESYFMEFTFEPGNYYFVGRETLAGRERTDSIIFFSFKF